MKSEVFAKNECDLATAFSFRFTTQQILGLLINGFLVEEALITFTPH